MNEYKMITAILAVLALPTIAGIVLAAVQALLILVAIAIVVTVLALAIFGAMQLKTTDKEPQS